MTPVAKIKPHPKNEPNPGHKKIGGSAMLKELNWNKIVLQNSN